MAAPPVARCLPFPGPGPNAVPIYTPSSSIPLNNIPFGALQYKLLQCTKDRLMAWIYLGF